MPIRDFLPRFPQRSVLRRKPVTERDLIRREAEIGAKLFGPIPAGHRREFFCLDKTTWIWHEEWVDENGRNQTLTTRYELRGSQVIKAQERQPYQIVDGIEAKHLYDAITLYYQRVMPEVYNVEAQSLAALLQ